GVEELQRWLEDLLRLGLAAAARQPARFWEGTAARLVDAQAPGLARLVRDLAIVPFAGAGWEERMLAALGRIQLLLDAFQRLDTLPEPVQADVIATIGLSPRQEAVLAGTPVGDCWQVLGERTEAEGRLRVRRTWLHGQGSGRDALLLAFWPQHTAATAGPQPGTAFQAELCFYPGNWPLRAVVRGAAGAAGPFARIAGHATIGVALETWTRALAHNPWLGQAPLALAGVVPSRRSDGWFVDDGEGRALPLAPGFTAGWRLLALSGGRPIGVFGEWDGRWLLPLGAATGEEYCRL
ncbi:MAG TPA: SWIM zinc finger family protein, partial [Dehalococcoidia bacterium]|nr:SWIM zinc finger family protein [Dehalococcoidia bacterium]